METVFFKDYMDFTCVRCQSYGYVFSDDFEHNINAVCESCNANNGLIFCGKCGIGNHLQYDLGSIPSHIDCPECGNKVELGDSFYSNRSTLFLESNLPTEFFDRIEQESRKAKHRTILILVIFLIVAGALVFDHFNLYSMLIELLK